MAFDASFFALVALILFFVLLWYVNTHRTIAKSLDDRAARIQAEIDEARELKEEAKQQLAEYQRRRREAEAEAKAKLEAEARAKVEAERAERERERAAEAAAAPTQPLITPPAAPPLAAPTIPPDAEPTVDDVTGAEPPPF